jgi:peptidoglycan/xylan/chitin deacetylase (PgdA/CDA1 family)
MVGVCLRWIDLAQMARFPRIRTLRAGMVRPLAAALALVLASCGDDAAAPELPVPTTVLTDPTAVGLFALGQTAVVTAAVRDQNGAAMPAEGLAWFSDDADVASVSSRGVVTAVGNGQTAVRARIGEAEAEVTVTVEQAAAALTLDADSLVFRDPGDTTTVGAFASDGLGAPIDSPSLTWSSGDTTIARVSSEGLVEATGSGTTWVQAESGSAVAALPVRVTPELVLVQIGTFPLDATVGDAVALSARVEDVLGDSYSGAVVSWSVGAGSGSIASQQETPSDVTGAAAAVWQLDTIAGTQRAFAALETRGRLVEVEFLAAVSPGEPVSAELFADSVLLSARGETAWLAPTYADRFANPTTGAGAVWTSRDPAIAAVSTDGLVTGGDAGSTWIVAGMPEPTDSILVSVVMRGAITVTFDDGFRSVFENAWPVFREFDLPANIAVNPVPVDSMWGDYMTIAMLDELNDAGWSVVSHTLRHDSLSTLSPAELDYDLRTTQQWIVDRGYEGWNVFVAPYHDYGPTEREAVSRYYAAARGISSDIVTPDTLASWQPDNPYLLTGREAEFVPYTTPGGRDEIRALLQRTLDEGVFVDLFFHRVPPEDVPALRELLTVLDDFRERVLPYHELYPIFARSVY